MEYAPHGELFTKITSFGKLAENEAKSNFSQIVSAVAHMVCTDNSTYFCSTSSAFKVNVWGKLMLIIKVSKCGLSGGQ